MWRYDAFALGGHGPPYVLMFRRLLRVLCVLRGEDEATKGTKFTKQSRLAGRLALASGRFALAARTGGQGPPYMLMAWRRKRSAGRRAG
jgi:hypothetical protein